MRSAIEKRSIVIGDHKTSMSLEQAFWDGLKEIAAERGKTLSELVTEIDNERRHNNLSSQIRLFVLAYYKERSEGKPDGESSGKNGGNGKGEFGRDASKTNVGGGFGGEG